MKLFKRKYLNPLRNTQRFLAYFREGGRVGALGILEMIEETGKWPPKPIFTWLVEDAYNKGRLSGMEVQRVVEKLMNSAEYVTTDELYTLVISRWIACGPLLDGLNHLIETTGITPSSKAVEDGLRQFIKKHPEKQLFDAAGREEIERRFGASIGQEFFEKIHSSTYAFYVQHPNPNMRWRTFPVILHLIKNYGFLPDKQLLATMIGVVKLNGTLMFDEDNGPYGNWGNVKDPNLLEQLRRLEQGDPIEQVLENYPLCLSIGGGTTGQEDWDEYVQS